MIMRKSGKWMVVWDDRILEFIKKEGSGSPSKISNSAYIHVTKQHVSRRLLLLAEHGLLEPLGNGVYVMSPEGQSYLKGSYDARGAGYNADVGGLD